MDTAKANQHRGLVFKIVIFWLCIFFLVGFMIATKSSADPVTISVLPEVPKEGEPVVATFNIANPSDKSSTTSYQFYVNGRLVENGITTIAPGNTSKYQYAYGNTLQRGEQVNFLLKTSSEHGSIDKMVSLPAYPPQLMTSFVSFAAFSTSVMSSMISMEYFSDTFGSTSGPNTGIIVVIVLICLLIFLEFTQALTTGKETITSRFRVGFKHMSTILFVILVGMVFTQTVMILL